jgi:predicted DNA-binding protein
MKTINVSDELHGKLKKISEKTGMSIQEIITLIVEKGLNTIMESYEFEIDNLNDIEKYKKDIEDFIKINGRKEEDFLYSLKTELFKKPVFIITKKI